jgi:plastocyanin
MIFRARRFLVLLLLGPFAVAGLRAGSIVGSVHAEPPPEPPGQAAGAGNYSSRRYRYVEKIDYSQLRDFVVNVEQLPGGAAPKEPLAVTTQKDANFEPHVLPISVGTTVRWPNEDDIFHNVFSSSEVKEFDLGYYKKEATPEVVFDKVGRVDVFCAIHTKMHCIILVLPNPYFSPVDAKGRYTIRNVPAGTYRVRAWHERLPSEIKDVVVPADGEVKVDFVLGVGNLPKS